MALSFMSIIFAALTGFQPPVEQSLPVSQDTQFVKYAQLQIQPEVTSVDPRLVRAASALQQAYPETDLSMLIYVKYGLHNMELFEHGASEFVRGVGADVSYNNPHLMLRIQSVSREITPEGERETFGLTLNEGAAVIAASRTTINCQGVNIANPITSVNTDKNSAKGCLIDAASVNEMFGRLADKI